MSTPYARVSATSTYRLPVARVTSAPGRHHLASWTIARGVGVAGQIIFLALMAGHLTLSQLTVCEMAAAIASLGLAEALKSMATASRAQLAVYGRGLTEVGTQCALAVLLLWLLSR